MFHPVLYWISLFTLATSGVCLDAATNQRDATPRVDVIITTTAVTLLLISGVIFYGICCVCHRKKADLNHADDVESKPTKGIFMLTHSFPIAYDSYK